MVRDDWEDQATAVKLLQREAAPACAWPPSPRPRHPRPRHPGAVFPGDGPAGRRIAAARLRRDYRLDPADALWVTRQTAEALAALHRAGFLHGDVKPDNMRLVDDGTAILIDLGFAHRPGENAAFLREGYVLGTADYLAPELCDPEPDDDQAATCSVWA